MVVVADVLDSLWERGKQQLREHINSIVLPGGHMQTQSTYKPRTYQNISISKVYERAFVNIMMKFTDASP